MEDITKYIGLLGFVPFVILVVWSWWYFVPNASSNDFDDPLLVVSGAIAILSIIIFFVGCLIWGIITLGRLL